MSAKGNFVIISIGLILLAFGIYANYQVTFVIEKSRTQYSLALIDECQKLNGYAMPIAREFDWSCYQMENDVIVHRILTFMEKDRIAIKRVELSR